MGEEFSLLPFPPYHQPSRSIWPSGPVFGLSSTSPRYINVPRLCGECHYLWDPYGGFGHNMGEEFSLPFPPYYQPSKRIWPSGPKASIYVPKVMCKPVMGGNTVSETFTHMFHFRSGSSFEKWRPGIQFGA
jgi:hypothetical protein